MNRLNGLGSHKIHVTVSDKVYDQLTDYADNLGISKAQLCTQFINQGIVGWSAGMSVLRDTDFLKKLLDKDNGIS